ncbi:hypothetical protein [Paracoccus sp. Ld10]|uniref:hypothetical protein n=1 Tax=Paracoccus sp. Ld10 TaxID=649158 RepID=UPI0038650DB2
MFDFARRVQEAAGDTVRRTAIKAVAGVTGLVAAGFLTAALWSWLATEMEWGSALASLTIGGGLIVLMIILLAASSKRRHQMPTTDDLKREVEARVSLATEAAIVRAKSEANRVIGMAESKAHSLMDEAGSRATKLASGAEQKLFGSVRETARAAGLTSSNVAAARDRVRDEGHQLQQAVDSNAGSITKLVGAFAVGVTLAAALRERGRTNHPDYDVDDLL